MHKMLLTVIFLISVLYSKGCIATQRIDDSDIPNSVEGPGEPLFLTPLIEQNKVREAKSASRVRHRDLLGVRSYSGLITSNKNFNSNLFFWFFPAQNNYENAPVIIWLQGGPGASMMFSVFVENGPYKIDESGKVCLSHHSWTKDHSVIYVDNPIGTGFSFTSEGGFARNQTQIGEELYEFLQQFFKVFSELKQNEFWIIGESYAGKFVPALGYTILKKQTSGFKPNLKGLAIGASWTDPINQNNFGPYLYETGLIDDNDKKEIDQIKDEVIDNVKNERWAEATASRSKLVDTMQEKSGLNNTFNYLHEQDPTLPLAFLSFEFVSRNDIRRAIHVGNLSISPDGVFENLNEEIMQSVAPWVVELLSNYRMLFYTGQVDIILAYPVVLDFLKRLEFNGAEEYKTAPRKNWRVDNQLAGYVKEVGNLTEVLVRKAGHIATYDQPKWCYDLIYKFIRNTPLS